MNAKEFMVACEKDRRGPKDINMKQNQCGVIFSCLAYGNRTCKFKEGKKGCIHREDYGGCGSLPAMQDAIKDMFNAEPNK